VTAADPTIAPELVLAAIILAIAIVAVVLLFKAD